MLLKRHDLFRCPEALFFFPITSSNDVRCGLGRSLVDASEVYKDKSAWTMHGGKRAKAM
jgi:hypothetical protein